MEEVLQRRHLYCTQFTMCDLKHRLFDENKLLTLDYGIKLLIKRL